MPPSPWRRSGGRRRPRQPRTRGTSPPLPSRTALVCSGLCSRPWGRRLVPRLRCRRELPTASIATHDQSGRWDREIGRSTSVLTLQRGSEFRLEGHSGSQETKHVPGDGVPARRGVPHVAAAVAEHAASRFLRGIAPAGGSCQRGSCGSAQRRRPAPQHASEDAAEAHSLMAKGKRGVAAAAATTVLWPSFQRTSSTSASVLHAKASRLAGVRRLRPAGTPLSHRVPWRRSAGATVLAHRDAMEAELFRDEGEGAHQDTNACGAGALRRRRATVCSRGGILATTRGWTLLIGGGRYFKYRPPWAPDRRPMEHVRRRSSADRARG